MTNLSHETLYAKKQNRPDAGAKNSGFRNNPSRAGQTGDGH